MASNNLFQRIKNSVKAQKSSFCSTSTSVTLLGSGPFPLNLVVSYTDCDGIRRVVPYGEVVMNNNFIPDCVQGGGPISITNGDETTSTLISDINEGDVLIEPKPIEPQQSSYKIFVQYGTTPCNTGDNIILQDCNLGANFIVDPTGYNLIQGEVYQMSLNPLGPVPIPVTQCYTVGNQTLQQAEYNITGMISQFIDCKACDGPSPSPPTPTVTFPTPTVTPPMVIAYIVGNTSYKNQIDACASSGGGTITVYSNSALQVNTTFLYTDSLLTTPYNSEGFVYHLNKGNYVLSTGPDGKLTSLSPCT